MSKIPKGENTASSTTVAGKTGFPRNIRFISLTLSKNQLETNQRFSDLKLLEEKLQDIRGTRTS